LIEYRADFKVKQFFVEFRADFTECRAFLIQHRADFTGCKTFLMECRADLRNTFKLDQYVMHFASVFFSVL